VLIGAEGEALAEASGPGKEELRLEPKGCVARGRQEGGSILPLPIGVEEGQLRR
jgi:hypothetical protein